MKTQTLSEAEFARSWRAACLAAAQRGVQTSVPEPEEDPEMQRQADELGSRARFRDAVTFWVVVVGAGLLALLAWRPWKEKR